MSYTTPDFADDVIAALQRDGYTVHARDEEGNDCEPDESAICWFCWAAPGMADCEVGDDCDGSLAAWSSALSHRLANSAIPVHRVGDETPEVHAEAGEFLTDHMDDDITTLCLPSARCLANGELIDQGCEPDLSRSGWVNVGEHSLRIVLDAAGNLYVHAYGLGCEGSPPLAALTVSMADACAQTDDERVAP